MTYAVIHRQPFDMLVSQEVNPEVVNVEDVGRGGFHHGAGGGADHAASFRGQRFALAVQPAVGRG
jgi:hypothetical protein